MRDASHLPDAAAVEADDRPSDAGCAESLPGWRSGPTETALMPILDTGDSRFVNDSRTGDDWLLLAVDVPNKYTAVALALDPLPEGGPDSFKVFPEHLRPCYTHYHAFVHWNSVRKLLKRVSGPSGGSQRLCGKVVVSLSEAVASPIRGQAVTRRLQSPHVFCLLVPSNEPIFTELVSPQKSRTRLKGASVAAYTANNASLTAAGDDDRVLPRVHLLLSTTVQWPFELSDPSFLAGRASQKAFPVATAQVTLVADCPGRSANDAAATGGSASYCHQDWKVDFAVEPRFCHDSDQYFTVQWRAVCSPSFGSDCPLLRGEDDAVAEEILVAAAVLCPVVVAGEDTDIAQVPVP